MPKYSIQVTGADQFKTSLNAQFEAWQDLYPLAEKVAELIRDDNIEARLAGDDRSGNPFAPLNHGNPLRSADIIRRGGTGPPLAPRGMASRIISEFVTSIFHPTKYVWTVLGEWPGLWWLKFHTSGPEHSGRLPIRDPAGVRPKTHLEIMIVVEQFARGILSRGG